MKWVLIALILLITGCAHVPYSQGDKIALAAFVTAGAADAYSTRQALDRGCIEMNPILSERPSDTDLILFKAAATALFYGLGEIWPDQRQTFYWIGAIGQGGAAVHNSQQP